MAREHTAGDRDSKMTELPRRTFLAGAGALLVGLSGCLGNDDGNEDGENGGDGNSGGNGSDGNDGGQSDPEITFTEDETNGVGVQVTNMGGYDAVWVEHENLDGGFQISETRDVPVLYPVSLRYSTGTSLVSLIWKPPSRFSCSTQTAS